MMGDDAAIAGRLIDEIEAIRAAQDGGPAFVVACTPFDAYTLVAVLQLAARHPDLSDIQLDVIITLASDLARQLIASATAAVGPGSTIEATLRAGFDSSQDRPVAAAVDDEEYPDLDDLAEQDDEPPDSYVLGERRCRYVVPSFVVVDPAESELDLSKCARCNRFFVMATPIRLFMREGNDVLGFEVCESCAPAVLARPATQHPTEFRPG